MPSQNNGLICLLTLASMACGACGANTPDPNDPAGPMSIADAQAVLQHVREDNGFDKLPAPVTATSISDVTNIIREDQLERFPSARDYMANLSGSEALSLRAVLEVLWADALLSTADVFRESAKRETADIAALEATAKTANSEALAKQMDARRESLDKARLTTKALETLSGPHLEASSALASEAQRQAPNSPAGFQAAAHVALLRRQWVEFDRNIRKAEALGGGSSVHVQYQRAIERAERFGQKGAARDALTALLDADPDIARARARLILLHDQATDRYHELAALREHSPRHPIVLLAGSTVDAEYKIAEELAALRSATGGDLEDAEDADDAPAEPATEAPAEPAPSEDTSATGDPAAAPQ